MIGDLIVIKFASEEPESAAGALGVGAAVGAGAAAAGAGAACIGAGAAT